MTHHHNDSKPLRKLNGNQAPYSPSHSEIQRVGTGRTPIAIVGIGCRFPGGADSPQAFWQLLCDGVDAITEPPASRWNMDRFYDPMEAVPGKSYARQGGFLENIDRFDAPFFGISPREAANMDPQHRLLLEVAWEALEDAGQVPDQLPTDSGVFIGISAHDYGDIQAAISERNAMNAYTLLGGSLSIAANRISYALNLKGPSMIVDTACSSSLVAVHLACQSIWNHESKMALAGGVNIIIRPEGMIGFSKASMLSPDGRCKAFDARANGFVRAEGAGVILLKPYDQAVAESDLIYATILSTVVNQDGHTTSITVPGEASQAAMLVSAYRQAGIEPAQVGYVEAHGTGTSVGDPIEARALGQVLSRNRPSSETCVMGSVKSNIGHLEPASGMAGLIKAALAVNHGVIPPNLHFQTPNPDIPFDELQLRVPQQLEAWPVSHSGDSRRYAGVNSFGFGGTNAHLVLADAPVMMRPQSNGHGLESHVEIDPSARLLPLSARSAEALAALAAAYRDFLSSHDLISSPISLNDICYSTSVRRPHHTHRLALVGESKKALIEGLNAFIEGDTEQASAISPTSFVSGRPLADTPKVAFVFSGMGPQWWAMGRQLLAQEPVFRAMIERCDTLLSQYTDWSLLDELLADEAGSRIQQTNIAQPAIFALQVALAAVWQQWGVKPDLIVGHSVGEVAAAYVAGALTLDDAVKVIFHRSRLQATTEGQGKMLAVGLPEQEINLILADDVDQVSIAAINSPGSVTLAGDTEALAEIVTRLEPQGTFTRFLNVEVPYHSPKMDAIKPELVASLADITPQPVTTPLFSTVTGDVVEGPELDGDYWGRNIRNPVLFAKAMTSLHQAGANVFLEVAPQPVLARSMRECLAQTPAAEVSILASLRRGQSEQATLLGTLGQLYTLGYPLDWLALYRPDEAGSMPQFVRLPGYPWQREPYWFESTQSHQARVGPADHPLLGEPLPSIQPAWHARLDIRSLPYLGDHAIHNTPTFPAAAYVEMALSAAQKRYGNQAMVVEELAFQKPLFLTDTPLPVQLTFEPGQNSFAIYSQTNQDWVQHAAGHMRPLSNKALNEVASLKETLNETLEQIQKRCPHLVDQQICYQQFAEVGLDYGPTFRGITQLWCGEDEVLGELQIPEQVGPALSAYELHPALLDAAFQVIIGLVRESKAMHLPARIERIRLYHGLSHLAPQARLWSHVRLVEQSKTAITVDIRLLDEAGNLLAALDGFRCQAVATRQKAGDNVDSLLYQYGWIVSRPGQAWELADHMLSPDQIVADLQPEVGQLSQEADRQYFYSKLEPDWDELYHLYVVRALHQLGWRPQIGQRFSADELADELGVIAGQRRLFTRLLELWADDGILRAVPAQTTAQPVSWEVCRLPEMGEPEALWQKMVSQHPRYLAEQIVIQRCGANLAAVLNGACDPLQLIFPDASLDLAEQLYQDAANARFYNVLVQKAITRIVDQLPPDRTIRILEIGAGTGGLTSYVLPQLPADRTEYYFTDISPQFTAQAEAKFRAYPFVTYQPLNIEADPMAQGLEVHSFNLILASNVFHATADLRQTLSTAKSLLASNGLLVVLEMTRDLRVNTLVWGLLDGWWRFADKDLRPAHPLITWQTWRTLLTEVGFTEAEVLADLDQADDPFQSVMMAQGPEVSAAVPTEAQLLLELESEGHWLIFADRGGVGQVVADRLQAQGQTPTIVEVGDHFLTVTPHHYQLRPESADDWSTLFDRIEAPVGVIYLWSLDIPADYAIEGLSLAAFDYQPVLNLVQTLTQRGANVPPRLWLVTRGSQDVTGNAADLISAPLWTLGRVIINEHPYLQCSMVDLSPNSSEAEIRALLAEFSTRDQEDEIALRGTTRYVHRLQRRRLIDLPPLPAANETGCGAAPTQPFYLEVTTPGILDDLSFRPLTRRQPGPGEVEVAVRATALNFKDVAKATGLLGDTSLAGTASGRAVGLECAGIISAVGDGIEGFQIGDAVIALTPNSFGSHTYADARFVLPKPAAMRFEAAATVSLVFATAHYALHHLGRIQPGERILIHSAAGGVGLAAIQIAGAIGAEIFATAGTPQKRAFLQALGIPATHVMDSRSLDFADQIMALTDGRGVDLVLNALAGDALEKGLGVLAPFGRFLELGKYDIEHNSRLGLRPFQNNLSFFAIDLDRLAVERPQAVGALLQEILPRFADGTYQPLPYRVFSIPQVVDAFRYMAQAKHIGKVVVSLTEADVTVTPAPADRKPVKFRPDGTYLLTGGLGGFGLAVAEWMVAHGARHLHLVGRSGAKTPEQQQAVQSLQEAGAQVTVLKADVSQEADVARMLAEIPADRPLRGIIHAAMVLDDALLVNLTPERFEQVMTPKVLGAWQLHTQTLQLPLDFFVLFSSASSAVGNPGQGSYVAANAFLEALAYYRRAQNLPALTISWGAIGGVGYVAHNQAVTDHLKRIGFELLPYQQALSVLGDVLQRDVAQLTVGAVDWQQWSNFNSAGVLPRFSQLITTELNQMQQDQHTPFLQQLAQTPVEGRRRYLQEHLRGQIAKVLGISKPEQIELQQSVFDLGLDSLMGVELQNRLEKSFERSLPQSLLFNHSSVTALVDHLVTDILASGIEFGAGSSLEAKKDRSQTANPSSVSPGAAASTTAKDHKKNGLSPITQLDLNREAVLDPAIRFDLTTLRESREPASIFLTGASGFLGAFLLDELLQQTTAKIYCLVRATDPRRAWQRIRDNLADYALWDDAFADRIVPVLGDLDLPRLGLSPQDYDHLAGQIEVIYHNGAWVNFLVPYTTLKKTNVLGTQEILRLAGQGQVKPLHFISSYSVFFSRERTLADQIRETDDLSPADTLCDNGYVRSKWVAEKMVTAARERGLPVAIYRPGVLFGDSRTGISNPNDFINCMILGCMQMESVPTENALMDLCPVDFAGQAIIHLSRQPQSIGQAFHLVNPNPLSWQEWAAWINGLGYPLQAVPYNSWKARLQTALADPATRNALYPFAAALPSVKGETDNFSLSQVFLEGRAPRFDCRQTLNGLTDSGIVYPAINADLLQRYFAYFVEKGVLHPATTDPIASR